MGKTGRTMSVFGLVRRIVRARPNTAIAILGLSLAIFPAIALTNLTQFNDFLADYDVDWILLNAPLMNLLWFVVGLLGCYGLGGVALVARLMRRMNRNSAT